MDTQSELDVQHQIADDAPADALISPPSPSASSTASLKRTAEVLDNEDGGESSASKKRQRKDSTGDDVKGERMDVDNEGTNAKRLVEEIGLELSCGCCTEICYNPVLVMPCQHYFCGSCYTLWTRNAGVNCPACRTAVDSIIPSRAIQSLIEVFLRFAPSRTRSEREREQADEIYTAGNTISVPTPRPKSPEFAPPQDNDAYHRPCPHCAPNNSWNWTCPRPIIDPSVDINRASLLTNGPPVGHANCNSCEHLHATRAPTTSRCDFCKGTYCGLVVPTRCVARRVREQKPLGFDSLADILQSMDFYEAFGVNSVEFDHLIDYLRERGMAPKHIYYGIADWIVKNPEGWQLLLNNGLFPEALTPHRFNDEEAQPETQQPPQPESTRRRDEGMETDSEDEDADPERPSTVTSAQQTPSPLPQTTQLVADTLAVPAPTTLEQEEPQPIVLDISAAAIVNQDVTTPIDVPSPQSPIEGGQLNVLPFALEVAEVEHPEVVTPPQPASIPEETAAPVVLDPIVHAAINDDQPTAIDTEEASQQPPASEASSSTATNSTTSAGSGDESRSGSEGEGSNTADAPQEPARPVTPPFVPHTTVQTLRTICRKCAREVMFWGAREWWIRERAKAIDNSRLDVEVWKRPDCEKMGLCDQENEPSHAREFNHIPSPAGWVRPQIPVPAPPAPVPAETEPSTEANNDQPPSQESNEGILPPASNPEQVPVTEPTTIRVADNETPSPMDVDAVPVDSRVSGTVDPEKVLHPETNNLPPLSAGAPQSSNPEPTIASSSATTTSHHEQPALVL